MAILLSRIRKLEKRYQAKKYKEYQVVECSGNQVEDCADCLEQHKEAIRSGGRIYMKPENDTTDLSNCITYQNLVKRNRGL